MTSIAVEGAIDGSTGSQTSSVVFDPGIPPSGDPRDIRKCRITVDSHRIKALPMIPVSFRCGATSVVLNALLDTAAEESFISTAAVRKFGLLVKDADVRKRVIMADGTSRMSDMVFQTKLSVGSIFKSTGSFYTLDLPHADMILSWEWMRANKIVLDASRPRVFAHYRKRRVELPTI